MSSTILSELVIQEFIPCFLTLSKKFADLGGGGGGSLGICRLHSVWAMFSYSKRGMPQSTVFHCVRLPTAQYFLLPVFKSLFDRSEYIRFIWLLDAREILVDKV